MSIDFDQYRTETVPATRAWARAYLHDRKAKHSPKVLARVSVERLLCDVCGEVTRVIPDLFDGRGRKRWEREHRHLLRRAWRAFMNRF